MRLADKIECTGCGACRSACPAGAIRLLPDEEGFVIPRVDRERCVDCGACEKTCPVLLPRGKESVPRCFAARARDESIVASSSSGGIFLELALKSLKAGGVVFGAGYEEGSLRVCHGGVEDLDGLRRLCGSKYVQSDIGGAFSAVRAALQKGRPVLFSGTPCQVAGLKSYLHEDDRNLLTVEVICHGVPPPRLFELLKKDLEKRHGKLTHISFRDKEKGWGSRAITGWYLHEGKVREGENNAYLSAFLEHLSLRHSCERCRFNSGRSGADITLGDFWGIGKVLPSLDDDKGVSAVLIHSDRGGDAFEKIDCIKFPVCLSDVVAMNPSYKAKRRAVKNRDRFMRCVYEMGIAEAYERFRARGGGGSGVLNRIGVVRLARFLVRNIRRG